MMNSGFSSSDSLFVRFMFGVWPARHLFPDYVFGNAPPPTLPSVNAKNKKKLREVEVRYSTPIRLTCVRICFFFFFFFVCIRYPRRKGSRESCKIVQKDMEGCTSTESYFKGLVLL